MDINVESGKAVNFLHYIRDNGYIGLTAIRPDGSLESITRCVKDKSIEAFIRKHNNNDGLYYTLNEPYDSAPNSKLKKEHIKSLYGIYIDADPDKSKPLHEERKRLLEFAKNLNNDADFPPTLIIDSGGGVQALWLFEKPIPATLVNVKAVEDYGRGLAKKYNTDSVQNIDRLLRLPFTLNIPNDLKKATGRTNALATVLYASQKRYSSLKGICTPIEAKIHEGVIDHNHDFDFDSLEPDGSKIPEELKKRMDSAVRMDEKLRALTTGKLKRNSRSDYDFAYASRLKAAGFNIQDTAQIMYILPNGKGEELTERDIVRCYDRADDPFNNLKLDNDYILKINSIPNPMIQLAAPKELDDKYGLLIPKRLITVDGLKMDFLHDVDWMYDEFLMKHGFNVIYGQSGAGKSFTTLDIAVHLAWGKSWNGIECNCKMAVLYCAAEAGRGMGKRVEAARRRAGVPRNATIEEFPFRVIPMSLDLMSQPSDIKDDILDVIVHGKILKIDSCMELGMVVFDTLSTTFAGGNENSSEDMGKYVTNTKRIQEELETSPTIVHHSGKDQSAGARGHSLLRAATDTEIEVRAEKRGDKWKREIEVKKQRESEDNYSFKFGLKRVGVGVNNRGKEVTTCQLVLENDVDFESVIPSVVDELPNLQKFMYFAVEVANKMHDNSTKMINAWFDYFEKNPDKKPQSTTQVSLLGTGTVGMESRSFGKRKNTPSALRTELAGKGLIKLNDKNQWVIV